jgi:lysozyme
MAGPINAVIDLPHHNETVDFEQFKGAGVVGVIHKATQGLRDRA